MTFRGRKVLGDDFLWNYMLFHRLARRSDQSVVGRHTSRADGSCSIRSASTPGTRA